MNGQTTMDTERLKRGLRLIGEGGRPDEDTVAELRRLGLAVVVGVRAMLTQAGCDATARRAR